MTNEAFDWFEVDAQLVEQDAERISEENKAFLAREEALTELDQYFMGMSVEDVETALNGLREYEKAVQAEREIEMGWHRGVTSEDTTV